MRKSTKTLAVASALVAGLAATPLLYAHESHGPGGSTEPGMTGQGGMMGMMGQMSEMMEGCSKMMQSMNRGGSDTPNEQWKKETPEAPDRKR